MQKIIIETSFELILSCPHLYGDTQKKYSGFKDWCSKKIENQARALYIYDRKNNIIGFMYLKQESYIEYNDINFSENIFDNHKVLKIGSLLTDKKIKKIGTLLLEESFKFAENLDINFLYGTVFEEYTGVISLLEKKGFYNIGEKKSNLGIEKVYAKELKPISKPELTIINYKDFFISVI